MKLTKKVYDIVLMTKLEQELQNNLNIYRKREMGIGIIMDKTKKMIISKENKSHEVY